MDKIRLTFSNPVADEYRWFAWYPVSTADRGWRLFSLVYKRKYTLKAHIDSPYRKPFFMYSVAKGVLA